MTTLYESSSQNNNPLFTLLIPTCNEELTIETFIDWCLEGIASSNAVGEILIIDSSEDRTAEIALSLGARVLVTPRRGLGMAYRDGLPYARGEFIIMGDADCTYDFRKINVFLESFKNGNDYVMGSRWLGTIQKGSMPFSHRRLGTPITTWILNLLYGSSFSDIHCGMRGIRKSSLQDMDLKSRSWEYASEMVLKSVLMDLRTVEVPVDFYSDRDGRTSHHKRSGWLSPYKAAFINLKMMLTYRLDFLATIPGLVLGSTGFFLAMLLVTGPKNVIGVHMNLASFIFSCVLIILGFFLHEVGRTANYFYKKHFNNSIVPSIDNQEFPSFKSVWLLESIGFSLVFFSSCSWLLNKNLFSNTNNFLFRSLILGFVLIAIGFVVFLLKCFSNFLNLENKLSH